MSRRISAVLVALAALVLTQAGSADARARRVTWQGGALWAGYVDRGPVTRVSGEFTVPTVSGSCTATSQAAVWVGLGGNGESTLAQLGLTLTPSGVGAWWEGIDADGGGQEEDVAFDASAGDQVKLALAFYDAHTTLRMRWTNLTTGATLVRQLTGAGRYFSGRTAEWIVERPHGHDLARFGAMNWTNAWSGEETTVVAAQPVDIQKGLYGDDGYTEIATESTPAGSPRSLTVTWRRCH